MKTKNLLFAPLFFIAFFSQNLNAQNTSTLKANEPTVFIPNTMTTGHDGQFHYFVNAENHKQFEMRIYSRWGEEIFKTNTVGKYWNGKYNDKIVEDDTYICVVMVQGLDGKN